MDPRERSGANGTLRQGDIAATGRGVERSAPFSRHHMNTLPYESRLCKVPFPRCGKQELVQERLTTRRCQLILTRP